METLKKPILQNGPVQLTFSWEDSHANHTPLQVTDLVKRIRDTSGQRCLEQLNRLNHVGLWEKTFMDCLIGTGDWYSTKFNLIWKMWATKSSRLYFQLLPSMPLTYEKEFGLLPTMQTQGLKNCKNGKTTFINYQLLPTPTTQEIGSKCKISENGRRISSNGKNTRSLNLARKAMLGLLPTPKEGGNEGYETRKKRQGHLKAISHLQANIEYRMQNNLLPTPDCSDRRSDKSKQWGLSNYARNSLLPTPKAIDGSGIGRKLRLKKDCKRDPNSLGNYRGDLKDYAYLKLLPTPTVMDSNGGDIEKVQARRQRAKGKKINGNGFGQTLNELANLQLLPTPMASDCGTKLTGTENQDSLTKRARLTTGKTSQLNPRFVAEMMGFPPNYTELPFLNGETKV